LLNQPPRQGQRGMQDGVARANVPGSANAGDRGGLSVGADADGVLGSLLVLLSKPVHQIEAYCTCHEHGENMDQG
jgi:hypothetical protein